MKDYQEIEVGHQRVIVVEFNEISWELMDEWLIEGDLPNFARLRNEGAWDRTLTNEPPELLDPWVTWTTFHTGVPQSEHGMEFLEQPAETIRVKRLWEIVAEASKKVGVFGSVSSWPPIRVDGFFIPGSFSPDAKTFPDTLEAVQELNVRYTRAHVPGVPQNGLGAMIHDALRMIRFGLDFKQR